MKIDRCGRAKILTQAEIQLLFSRGFTRNPPRDRALFGICLYTACRINEAVTLRVIDVFSRQGEVRTHLNLRKENTKGKLGTRTIPILQDLRLLLEKYPHNPEEEYLFPGVGKSHHLHVDTAGIILRQACQLVGIEGVSTHSFRRTALTRMSNAGIPLRIIQEISGHRKLDELYKYLEVEPSQLLGAIATLQMLSPVEVDREIEMNNDRDTTIKRSIGTT